MATDSDVVIAGAGPVGLITALGLARLGVSVTVLEAEPEIVNSPRAMVYHWTVLERLDDLGILEEVERRGFRKDDYEFRDLASGETVPYSLGVLAGETNYPYNVHLGQHLLAEVALARLRRYQHARVIFGTRVTGISQDGHGVAVIAQAGEGAQEIRGKWAIGADGARSAVRSLLGLSFDGFTWDERFVATNVYYDFERYGFARSVLLSDPVHGAIIAKIDNDGLWRCTYSEDASLAESAVQDRIPDHFSVLLPGNDHYELERFTPYRMHQRAADTFRVRRVLLAGDAAHATNPTGGLGLTSGLFDSYALQDALAAVLVDGAHDSLLDTWAEERRRIFLDIASPAASENKRVIYSETDPQRRREDIENVRHWASDPTLLRQRLHFTKQLESVEVPRVAHAAR